MLLNDTPTVQATRPSHAWLVGTATAPCCDVDHISEASLPKGQDAASRGQVGGLVEQHRGDLRRPQRSRPAGGRTPRASNSWAMALSVPAAVHSMFRSHRYPSRGCQSAEASTGLSADELCFRPRAPFFPATRDLSSRGSERAAGQQSPLPSMALSRG